MWIFTKIGPIIKITFWGLLHFCDWAWDRPCVINWNHILIKLSSWKINNWKMFHIIHPIFVIKNNTRYIKKKLSVISSQSNSLFLAILNANIQKFKKEPRLDYPTHYRIVMFISSHVPDRFDTHFHAYSQSQFSLFPLYQWRKTWEE